MKTKEFAFGVLTGLGIAVILAGLLAAIKPKMPVEITFREAMLDRSLVAEFRNSSGQLFKVAFELQSQATGTTKRGEMVLAPNEPTEVGWAQGWRFVPGERIVIKNSNYRTLEVTVPQLASR